jgi:poly-gamma-glutamate synthesis protein (capsule biosynthesis protein)
VGGMKMNCKILVTGDFCPIGRNAEKIANNDFSVFGDFGSILKDTDFAITNLEAPLTETNNKIKKSGPNMKGNPNTAKMLASFGFNLVTTANNHILDYGAEGIKDTLDICDSAELNYVGCGKNIQEARKPFITTIGDIKIGVLNFAENEFCAVTKDNYGANPMNEITNYYDIKNTKEKVDYLIVIIHGGREHYQLPTPKQRERYRFYVDSGADIVAGHHTHCYSGYEIYNEKPIFYSLGNFIFDYKKKYQTGLWTKGYAVLFKIDKSKINFELIPYHQGRIENPKLVLLNDEEKETFNKDIMRLNKIINNDALFNDEWNKYIKSQKLNYKSMLLLQNLYIRTAVARNLLPPVFLHSREHQLLLLNLLRCESHREIMTNVLEEDLL